MLETLTHGVGQSPCDHWPDRKERKVLWQTFLVFNSIQPSVREDEETEGLGQKVQWLISAHFRITWEGQLVDVPGRDFHI